MKIKRMIKSIFCNLTLEDGFLSSLFRLTDESIERQERR